MIIGGLVANRESKQSFIENHLQVHAVRVSSGLQTCGTHKVLFKVQMRLEGHPNTSKLLFDPPEM